MSRRGLIPLALAVGFGIANGYVTFQPAFEEEAVQKLKRQEILESSDLGPNIIEVPINKKDAIGDQDQEKATDTKS